MSGNTNEKPAKNGRENEYLGLHVHMQGYGMYEDIKVRESPGQSAERRVGGEEYWT